MAMIPPPDGPAGGATLQLRLRGLSCSFCAGSITRALGGLDGVYEARVNLAHEEALIRYDPGRIAPVRIEGVLRDLGFRIRDPDRARAFDEEAEELRREGRRLAVAAGAAGAALVVMAVMWLGRLSPAAEFGLGAVVMPGLAVATVFGAGRRILGMAWASLRRGILNQHVLLELGAFGGLLGGVLGYFDPAFPQGDFFAVAVFLTAYHLLSGTSRCGCGPAAPRRSGSSWPWCRRRPGCGARGRSMRCRWTQSGWATWSGSAPANPSRWTGRSWTGSRGWMRAW